MECTIYLINVGGGLGVSQQQVISINSKLLSIYIETCWQWQVNSTSRCGMGPFINQIDYQRGEWLIKRYPHKSTVGIGSLLQTGS